MLQLFSTLGCHLCEDAKNILRPLLSQYNISFNEIEISDRDEWVEAYGVRIPVLKSDVTQAELDWPFDAEECEKWLILNAKA